jgi:exosome complex component RRP42
MPPQAALVNLSPAELSFLRSTLSQTPPLRLDVTKGPRDFRSMRAEYDVLPNANGSARIALEDGTEALVGVKAEVGKTPQRPVLGFQDEDEDATMSNGDEYSDGRGQGQNSWVEMSVEIPGFRDDDALPVFLASMLTESLLASGALKDRLYINRRFHWKLYIDVRLPPSLVCSFECLGADSNADPPSLAAALLPARPTLHGHPPRPPHHPPARAEV